MRQRTGTRIARLWVPGQGPRLGLCDNGTVRVLVAADGSPLDSLQAVAALAGRTGRPLAEVIRGLARAPQPAYQYAALDRPPAPDSPHLLLPVVPPEVWAAGVTYERLSLIHI